MVGTSGERTPSAKQSESHAVVIDPPALTGAQRLDLPTLSFFQTLTTLKMDLAPEAVMISALQSDFPRLTPMRENGTTEKGEPLMTDRFANTQSSLSSPASSGFAVTPSDAASLAETSRALYVGEGGNLSVRMLSGESLNFTNVSSGSLLPLRVTAVLTTGTTAGAIVALI